MRKHLFLLTGSPGIGKTTALLKTVETLKTKGCTVGGMLSCEVRSKGSRVGFEILDIGRNKRGWLAHVNRKDGPRVGRYGVNLVDLDNIGAEAISYAVSYFDVVVIDEVGPMELFSQKFKDAVSRAVESRKIVIAVVHWKARDSLIDNVKAREDAEMYVVTSENRDRLHEVLMEKASAVLQLGK